MKIDLKKSVAVFGLLFKRAQIEGKKYRSHNSKKINLHIFLIFPKIFLFFSLPILLLLTNLYLFTSPLWLHYEYRKSFSPPIYRYKYNYSQRLELAKRTLYYIRSNKDVDFLRNLKIRGFPVYSEREITHLVEIKSLVQKLFNIHFIALIISLFSLSILWLNKQSRQKVPLYVLRGCLFLLAVIIVFFFAIFFNWNTLLHSFHQIFFTQGTYSFSFSFTIIQLFPPRFWFDTTLLWLLLTLTETLIIAGLMLWANKRRYLKGTSI